MARKVERNNQEAAEAAREREAAEAAAVDNDQAEISDSDGTASIEPPANTVTVDEVEAANRARLARGEDPVVPDNVESPNTPFGGDPRDMVYDGIGEDTQAVKQSSVRVLRDNQIVERDARTGEDRVVAEVRPSNPELVEAHRNLSEAEARAAEGRTKG